MEKDIEVIKQAIEMALRFPPFVEPCQCDGVSNQTDFWRDGICGKHQLLGALESLARVESRLTLLAADGACAHEWDGGYPNDDNVYCIHCGMVRPAAKA